MTDVKNHFFAYGLIMIIIGAIIAFFPGILLLTFKGILIISAVICAFVIIHGIFGKDSKSLGGSITAAAAIALMYIFSDKIISFGIGVIGGIAVVVMGIKRFISAANSATDKDIRTINGILGAILLAVGVLCTFNPFDAGWIARILIGIVMIINGIFNLFVAHECKKRIVNDSPDIIDVNSFTIDK